MKGAQRVMLGEIVETYSGSLTHLLLDDIQVHVSWGTRRVKLWRNLMKHLT